MISSLWPRTLPAAPSWAVRGGWADVASFAVTILSVSCYPQTGNIHTDLTGTWPVTFEDLARDGTSCTLEGVTLVIQQPQGREREGGWEASLSGSHSGGTLTCDDEGPTPQSGGTITGSLRNSRVTITLSSGGRLEGTINRPTMSTQLVELVGNRADLGSARWVADPDGATIVGGWRAGPLETATPEPLLYSRPLAPGAP